MITVPADAQSVPILRPVNFKDPNGGGYLKSPAFLYATAKDRDAIKLILGAGKYFFGVPYQLRNT